MEWKSDKMNLLSVIVNKNITDVFISLMAIIVLVTAVLVHFDSKGDKSNGWAWKCALWIIILLGKIWL